MQPGRENLIHVALREQGIYLDGLPVDAVALAVMTRQPFKVLRNLFGAMCQRSWAERIENQEMRNPVR